MIKKALILFVFLYTCFGFAQTNSVIGKCKIVAIDNGEVYYNVKTDSISIISEDLKEMYTDESQMQMLKELMKKVYTNNPIEFDENGVFKMKTGLGGTIESKYKNDAIRNVIIMESKNSLNETVIDEMPYKFINKQLHFIMAPQMSLTLEK